jgi:hypothetical protein
MIEFAKHEVATPRAYFLNAVIFVYWFHCQFKFQSPICSHQLMTSNQLVRTREIGLGLFV